MTAVEVPAIRSALFVPGHRGDLLEKVDRWSPDAVIIDLEDAVPNAERAASLGTAGDWIANNGHRINCLVRINPLDDDSARNGRDDLAAIVHDNLLGVLLPKVEGPEDVVELDQHLAHAEGRAGVDLGAVRIWPLLETARAVRSAFEIATASRRLTFLGGAGGDGGDFERSLGAKWDAEHFSELAYSMGKVLVDSRAAGILNPMSGLITNVSDDQQMERFAKYARTLGYEGVMVIHPRHVSIANDAFSPTEEELATAQEIVDALELGEEKGLGAVVHGGSMIDAAHLKSAQRTLALAGRLRESANE